MSSRDNDEAGQPPSKPISLSLSKSNGLPKKTGFNIQSSNRGRPTGSPASGRSLPRRPHQLGNDDDSDEDEVPPVHEEVSGFDTHTGGAITMDGQAVDDAKKPLIIPVTSKNNWRDRAGLNVKKGKKNLLPREVQAMQEAERNGQAPGGEPTVETDAPSMAFGLSFAQESAAQEIAESTNEDQSMPDAAPVETTPLTDDQIAMQALIRESKGEVERRSDLVIQAAAKDEAEDEEAPVHHSETSSFRTDVATRPESATLDAYNAIPVEEFGAALLRGMGWKDGQSIGRGDYSSATAAEKANKPRIPERRPGFLGIGAKDSSGGKGAETELGAWGKSAMRKASRKQGEGDDKVEGVYMPVTMRNKKTGERLTEEELAAKKKEAESKPAQEDDWRERRDRNLEKSGRDKDREYRKRDYDDEEDRSRRKTGSSRRDRSRSSGRHSSSRSSRYDDADKSRRDDRSYRDRDYDRDRRRDRDDDKDRRRDGDRERDRDRSYRSRDDRYSSSRHSSQSSRNDRDRERDRDSRRSRRDD
ncbi:uncharacterized protein N7529_000551 [Penicillium soppii]|jgi:hypothetical protein|uniref:uncharacterized protein n=1 Tax=Penicillium soppii TaxID=69789 RepID=UPI002548315E|nr:uncharacterized protein N7529_000551 [Penicillium soppii]KAJ5881879.1 hypothetical protein N7529_000551 [Penicillium soppii]